MADPLTSEHDQDLAQLKLQVKQLSILHNIARAVTSILDLQSVLNRIVDAAVYLTQAEEGFLMLYDAETEMLHLRAGRGLGEKEARVMRIPVNDSLSGQVYQSG
ncbi:MAG: GAF domain-containing protein, partial [Chloroflexota bacterium]